MLHRTEDLAGMKCECLSSGDSKRGEWIWRQGLGCVRAGGVIWARGRESGRRSWHLASLPCHEVCLSSRSYLCLSPPAAWMAVPFQLCARSRTS